MHIAAAGGSQSQLPLRPRTCSSYGHSGPSAYGRQQPQRLFPKRPASSHPRLSHNPYHRVRQGSQSLSLKNNAARNDPYLRLRAMPCGTLMAWPRRVSDLSYKGRLKQPASRASLRIKGRCWVGAGCATYARRASCRYPGLPSAVGNCARSSPRTGPV